MSFDQHHLETATIEAFALGSLGTAELRRVAEHLSGCPSCSRLVQDVPDDRLVQLLRRPPAAKTGITLTA